MVKKIYLFFIGAILLGSSSSFAQLATGSKAKWQKKPFEQNVFIENKGQFSRDEQKDIGEKIYYSTRKGNIYAYFTKGSIVFRYDSVYTDKSTDKEGDGDKEHVKFRVKHEFLRMSWQGANTNPDIEIEEPVTNYYTYGNPNDIAGKSGIRANAWKKLIYHNIYPGIDMEFFYPQQGGIEYSIIVHPGADVNLFKMSYSGNALLSTNNHNITISTPFASFTDHAPNATIDNGNGHIQQVPVAFTLSGNSISFSVNPYDRNTTLTIDPWISSPAFLGANQAYDLDIDLKSNVYVYGSTYPYLIDKFDNAGNLLWTYTSTFAYTYNAGFSFYGGMCVDGHSGSSFIAEGFDQGGSHLIKVNTNGIQVATNVGDASYQEIWRLAYDNCEQKGVMLGGGTTGNSFQIAVLDTTLATFNPTQIEVVSHMDFSMLTLDHNGNCYVVDDLNALVKAPLPTFSPQSFNVPSGYGFGELSQPKYIYAGSYPGAGGNGFNGLVTSGKYLYSYDGATLKKWNITTGAAIASVAVHNVPFTAGGLTASSCGYIYLGVRDSISQYDSTLKKINTYLLPDTVYDMKIDRNNNRIFACGKGFACAVDVNPSPINISVTPPSSCSACDAQATATFNCGTSPFTYSWSNGSTTQTVNGLCAGIYSVKVTDASCPSALDSALVIINGKIGYNVSVKDTNPGCLLARGNITAYPTGGTAPYSYSWSNGKTTQKDTGLAAGTYTCTITDNNGCKAFLSATLINPPPPNVTISPLSDSLCGGGKVQLTAKGASNYSWTPALSLSCKNCANPVATPTVTTTYTVTGTDTNGCVATATAIINVYSSPTPVIKAKDSVCAGYVDTFSVAGGNTYIWDNGATTSSTQYRLVVTQTITVQAFNGNCSKDTSIVIHVVSPVAKIKALSDSVCQGDSTLLSGSGGLTYKWNTGSTLTSIWVKPQKTATYTLYAYEGTCKDSALQAIKIAPKITAAIAAVNDTVCPYGSTTITATGIGGKVTKYRWNNGATSASITVHDTVTTTYTATVYGLCDSVQKVMQVVVVPLPKPVISGLNWRCKGKHDTLIISSSTNPTKYLWDNGKTTTTYVTGAINADSLISVTAYNSLGCPVTIVDTVYLRTPPAPVVTYTTPFCAAQAVYMTASSTGTFPPFTYSWSTGQTGSSITIDPGPDSTTTYTVYASNGCVGSATATVIPNVPILNACCSQILTNLGDTTILVASGNSKIYQWQESPDKGTITCINPPLCDSVRVITSVTTSYTVVGTDSNGCQGEQVLLIDIDVPCFDVRIPNVITPNNPGPLGLNGLFYIRTLNMSAWSIIIYDRWGKEMYSSTNPGQYWTGTTKGGSKAPDGVYYYIIDATCQQITYKKDGFVQLIR